MSIYVKARMWGKGGNMVEVLDFDHVATLCYIYADCQPSEEYG